MALVPVSGPAVEPLSLAETKAHLRVSGSAEDLLIASLITAARVHLELALGCAFITQSWSWFLDAWPRRARIELPLGPVRSITALRVLTAGDVVAIVPPTSILLTGRAVPPYVSLKDRTPWAQGAPQPAYAGNGIEIEFVAGFGNTPADVPEPIRRALLLLIAQWSDQRSPIEIGAGGAALPPEVAGLTTSYRQVRL